MQKHEQQIFNPPRLSQEVCFIFSAKVKELQNKIRANKAFKQQQQAVGLISQALKTQERLQELETNLNNLLLSQEALGIPEFGE